MNNMKNTITASVILSTALLTACGGTDTGSGGPTSKTSINSYEIAGSETVQAGDVVPINAGVNEGAFEVNWDVSSSNPYHVRLYVSDDAILSTDDDIQFFSQNCGTPSSIYNCNRTANFDCSFSAQNQIVCNETTYNRGKNIGSFLNSLPQQAYLIMQACNGLFDSCKDQAIAIELQ